MDAAAGSAAAVDADAAFLVGLEPPSTRKHSHAGIDDARSAQHTTTRCSCCCKSKQSKKACCCQLLPTATIQPKHCKCKALQGTAWNCKGLQDLQALLPSAGFGFSSSSCRSNYQQQQQGNNNVSSPTPMTSMQYSKASPIAPNSIVENLHLFSKISLQTSKQCLPSNAPIAGKTTACDLSNIHQSSHSPSYC